MAVVFVDMTRLTSTGRVEPTGGAMKVISTPAVETAIKQDAPLAALYYQDEGHEFCCITFADRPAWCHDLATGEWHERSGTTGGPWLANVAFQDYGQWYVGTNNGVIASLTRSNTDMGAPLVRTMVSKTLQMDGKRFKVPELRMQALVGHSNPDRTYDDEADVLQVDGTDVLQISGTSVLEVQEAQGITTPQMMLRVSADHGRTWGQQTR